MSKDEHPCDKGLGEIHGLALSLAAKGWHGAGLALASAHEQIQGYLVGEDDRIAEAVAERSREWVRLLSFYGHKRLAQSINDEICAAAIRARGEKTGKAEKTAPNLQPPTP